MRSPWTEKDLALLRRTYKVWPGAGPVPFPPTLTDRHSIASCRQVASTMGITRGRRPMQPDVPFRLKVAEAAYLAGLIDGEGHVAADKPLLQITTTTPEIIDWLVATIPIGRTQGTQVTSTGKPIHRWLLSTTLGCARLYRQVLPYLLIKEKRDRMQAHIDSLS